jgi:pimeloyl-ACP methyl ester carboxylesterase
LRDGQNGYERGFAFAGEDPPPASYFIVDRMHREAPTLTVADLAGYPEPALIMVGDSDEEIPIEHTPALREGLPEAQLGILPGAGHGSLDARIVIDFLADREEET